MFTRYYANGDLSPDEGQALVNVECRPYYGSYIIDDNTGFVSASTPTAEKVDGGAPITISSVNHWANAAEAQNIDSGEFVCQRKGRYRFWATFGEVLSGNASVVTIQAFKNGVAITGAKTRATFAATAVFMSLGNIEADLALDLDDTVDIRVTGTVGTVALKRASWGLVQIDDH